MDGPLVVVKLHTSRIVLRLPLPPPGTYWLVTVRTHDVRCDLYIFNVQSHSCGAVHTADVDCSWWFFPSFDLPNSAATTTLHPPNCGIPAPPPFLSPSVGKVLLSPSASMFGAIRNTSVFSMESSDGSQSSDGDVEITAEELWSDGKHGGSCGYGNSVDGDEDNPHYHEETGGGITSDGNQSQALGNELDDLMSDDPPPAQVYGKPTRAVAGAVPKQAVNQSVSAQPMLSAKAGAAPAASSSGLVVGGVSSGTRGVSVAASSSADSEPAMVDDAVEIGPDQHATQDPGEEREELGGSSSSEQVPAAERPKVSARRGCRARRVLMWWT